MLTQPASLPHLRTVFDRQDIIRALGRSPARTTLARLEAQLPVPGAGSNSRAGFTWPRWQVVQLTTGFSPFRPVIDLGIMGQSRPYLFTAACRLLSPSAPWGQPHHRWVRVAG